MKIDYRLVQVVDVGEGTASVKDQLGKPMSLRTDIRRVGGKLPVAGEFWLIDRTLGDWTFAALISSEEDGDFGGGTGDDMLTLMLMGG